MKKICFVLAFGFLTATVFAQKINDPNAESRTVSGFNAVDVSNAFDIVLTQGNSEAVAVSASEKKYIDQIKVEVKNGVLMIRYEGKGKILGGNHKDLKAYISVKNINAISISGATDLYISGTLRSEELTLTQSGASDAKGKIEAGKLTVKISGASDAVLSGSVGHLWIDASGASDFKGFNLTSDICDAKASGASDIKITVQKELSAKASGASDVHYKGNGVVTDMKSSGSSSVTKS